MSINDQRIPEHRSGSINITTKRGSYKCVAVARRAEPIRWEVFEINSKEIICTFSWSDTFGLEESNKIDQTMSEKEMEKIRQQLELRIRAMKSEEYFTPLQLTRKEQTEEIIDALLAPAEKDTISLPEVLVHLLKNQLKILNKLGA